MMSDENSEKKCKYLEDDPNRILPCPTVMTINMYDIDGIDKLPCLTGDCEKCPQYIELNVRERQMEELKASMERTRGYVKLVNDKLGISD